MRFENVMQLLEFSFTPEQAFAVLHRYYPDLKAADTHDKKKLQQVYRSLSLKHHPDHGGDTETFQKMNAAYQTLKNGGISYRGSSSASSRSRNDDDVPEWAWAGWNGGMAPDYEIQRNDYRDVNYIRKTLWEKSGKSKQRWTVWNFDGKFFRGVWTVFGNKKIFKDMAEAMEQWEDRYYKRYAFFAQRGNSPVHHLIYLNGKKLNGDITFAITQAKRNDQNFRDRLRQKLEGIDVG